MITATTVEPESLADVVHALGDIPVDRIISRPFPGTTTKKDFLRCVNGEPKRLIELIDGILVEKAMGPEPGSRGSSTKSCVSWKCTLTPCIRIK